MFAWYLFYHFRKISLPPPVDEEELARVTGWSKSGIQKLIRSDSEINEIWIGPQNNQHGRGSVAEI